jgi:transcriptional regulator with XRE-family HTH domain
MIKSGSQIRAARALLGLRLDDLAAEASLNRNSVINWEHRETIPTGKFREPWAVQRIREALARRGIEFVSDAALGVQIRKVVAVPQFEAEAA